MNNLPTHTSNRVLLSILIVGAYLSVGPVSAQVLDPITGVTIQSSSHTYEGAPANTVSNNSLIAGPSNVLGASDSLGNSGFDFSANAYGTWTSDLPGNITYNLGAVYNVSDLLIWNFSQEGFANAGANSVEILTSTTGAPGSFTSVGTYTFNEVTGDPGYGDNLSSYIVPAQVLSVTIPNTQYIELNVLTNYGFTGAAQFGINEVNFVGTAVSTPEPSTYALMLGGLALLGFCIRRKAGLRHPNI